VPADFGWAEFELLETVECRNSHDSQSDETTNTASGDKEEEEEHKATTGDMKSSDNSFDSFDGVGVVDVVEALQLKCNVQALGRACQRLIDYGRREYLRKFLRHARPARNAERTAILCSRRRYPQNAALVAHR
jgi:hypothetical protein